jgi:hypothetical protein
MKDRAQIRSRLAGVFAPAQAARVPGRNAHPGWLPARALAGTAARQSAVRSRPPGIPGLTPSFRRLPARQLPGYFPLSTPHRDLSAA